MAAPAIPCEQKFPGLLPFDSQVVVDSLARQLHLLYDGAGVSARMDRDPSAATTARAAATALFDAAVKSEKAPEAA